jgi:uncharacterized BrkB/YihY/UPF0761 family membrane protein
MKAGRIYLAGVVLGLTLAAAVWILTYRVWTVYEWIDVQGTRFHPSERMRVSPWWSVPLSVLVLLVGFAASFRLLPERRSLINRVVDYLTALSPARR